MASIGLIGIFGVTLDYPHSSKSNGSRFGNMQELRVQYRGMAYRLFYAFDPRRYAVLLIGGVKDGNEKRFYDEMIPVADTIYQKHLEVLKTKRGGGLSHGKDA